MMKISEINKRTTERKKNRNSKKKKSVSSKRVREDGARRSRRMRDLQKIEEMTEEAKSLGKTTKGGKRVCMWEQCTTVLSVYNLGKCCANHQHAWNMKNSVPIVVS